MEFYPVSLVEMIDSERASEYLTFNTSNRNVSEAWVAELAQTISAGRRVLTHQGIAFDTNGRLVDGQHTLLAIIKSGRPTPVMVTRNVPPEAFDVIDSGRKRTVGDILVSKGVPQATVLPNVSRMVLRCQRIPEKGWSGYSDVAAGITRDVIMEFTLKHENDLLVAVQRAETVRRRVPRIRVSAMATAVWLVADRSERSYVLEQFVAGVATGANLRDRDPRLVLRNRFNATDAAVVASNQEFNKARVVMILKAWNSFARSQPMSQLKAIPGEAIPKIV